MYRTWTRRRTSLPPPFARARVLLLGAAVLLTACLLPACGGKDKNENRIKPIEASLTIVPFPGTPDPAVFLEKTPASTGDLVVLNVKLRNGGGTPIAFDAFTLEFTYDFRLIQAGTVFDVNPAVMGDCNATTTCDPLCSTNAASANDGLAVDANGKAHLVMGVAARASCPIAKTGKCSDNSHALVACLADSECQPPPAGPCAICQSGETCVSVTDTTLVTIGFLATGPIAGEKTLGDPNSAPGRITLISGPGHGDCEILSGAADLGVSCVDGNAFLTATN